MAVKIENNTGKDLQIGKTLHFYSGENAIYPMEPRLVHKELKQGVPIYLLYSLIFLTKTDCDYYTGVCTTQMVFPIGIPITIGNMAVAGSANTKFLAEMETYNIADKVIGNGDTKYALIGIPDTGLQPIKIRMTSDSE